MKEVLHEANAAEEDCTEQSIDDEDIMNRNMAILREAEANCDMLSYLWIMVNRSRIQMVETFYNLEEEDRRRRDGGRREKKRAVRRMWRKEKFNMMMIQETKIKDNNPKLLQWLWGNDNIKGEFVDVEGNSKGLLTCWKDDFSKEEPKIKSRCYILLVASVMGNNLRCGAEMSMLLTMMLMEMLGGGIEYCD
ncbi:hypothetical protein DITRI_Ditri09bG0078100 [Diplodiscus trichospermus]